MRAEYLPSERTFYGHCFCVFRNGSKTQPRSRIGTRIFGAVLIAGLIFIGTSISHDLADLTFEVTVDEKIGKNHLTYA
jgi:hypothetical protein